MVKKLMNYRGIVLTVALLAVIVCAFYFAAKNSSAGADQKQLDGLAEAVRRAAVQCYAVEGFYPPDVGYLEQNYGLSVDKSRYFIAYSGFSSASLPQIDVFRVDQYN